MLQKAVLVVDDEEQLLEILTWELEDLNCKVKTISSVQKAKDLLIENKFDLVLSDIKMPDGDGFELLKHVQEKNINVQVVLISGFSQYEVADLKKAGALALVSKPIDMDKLKAIIESV